MDSGFRVSDGAPGVLYKKLEGAMSCLLTTDESSEGPLRENLGRIQEREISLTAANL